MSKQKPSAKARRTAARLAAVQALYQLELADGNVEHVLGEFAANRLGAEIDGDRLIEPDRALLADIVRGVTRRRTEIDALVTGALDPQWSLDRLELLLRAILEAGAWELLANSAVAPRIVIAEYIELTHAFFAGKEPGMVNAVLDRLARVLRPDELASAGDG